MLSTVFLLTAIHRISQNPSATCVSRLGTRSENPLRDVVTRHWVAGGGASGENQAARRSLLARLKLANRSLCILFRASDKIMLSFGMLTNISIVKFGYACTPDRRGYHKYQNFSRKDNLPSVLQPSYDLVLRLFLHNLLAVI